MTTLTQGKWTARIILNGCNYGSSNSLLNDSGKPLIEFYDNTYASLERELGQFVQRYYLETFLESNSNTGLILQGGVPEWVMNINELLFFKEWAKGEVGITPQPSQTSPA